MTGPPTSPGEDRPAVRVRDARPDDLAAVVDFNAALAAETEAKALDRDRLTRGVAAALAGPDRLRYWVAEVDGQDRLVGQAAVTREWSDWRNGWIWWLQSVYVHPEGRGRGVFRALYARIRDEARCEGAVGLRLYVEASNHRARRAYEALGMAHGGYHVYEEMFGAAPTTTSAPAPSERSGPEER